MCTVMVIVIQIKTDTARIVRQDLLQEEDDMRTSSMPKVLVGEYMS